MIKNHQTNHVRYVRIATVITEKESRDLGELNASEKRLEMYRTYGIFICTGSKLFQKQKWLSVAIFSLNMIPLHLKVMCVDII